MHVQTLKFLTIYTLKDDKQHNNSNTWLKSGSSDKGSSTGEVKMAPSCKWYWIKAVRGQTDKSNIHWYAVNNNKRATVWPFSVNNQALIQIWISSLIKFVLALNKHTYTLTHTHTRSRFPSIGQVPSCLRNLDWRGKSQSKAFLFFHRNRGKRATRAS